MFSTTPKNRAVLLFAAILLLLFSPKVSASDESARDESEPAHKKILKDAKAYRGLFTVYRKGNKLITELERDHYKHRFIVLMSIARGIGENPLLGGMTWSDGDEWVWCFRKVDKRVLVIRKNVRFRADKDTPAAMAVQHAYNDSVLFSLPILGEGPSGGDLVDLTPVFMSDLPQISRVLSGFYFSADKSTWAEPRVYENNIEVEVAATYASNGRTYFESVPDSRGVTINVHYSISKIRRSEYKPRLADDRVGYFLTAVKDYSKQNTRDRFVRFINRWHLEKADPTAELSPPKKPIIFWLENTVPFKYRKTIRDGILEWNKAFEKAGFANAIEVRQQPDDPDWDPEDVNYNTFRWITSSAGFAMGPSRVNPYTGEILDADILFDADFLQMWRNEFEHMTPESIAAMTGGALDSEAAGPKDRRSINPQCRRQQDMARQFLFGAVTFSTNGNGDAYETERDKMILQGLKATVMHEVGHTLGLRHNFKGSTYRTLEELNDSRIAEEGMISSVMDYDAVNIVGDLDRQGDYFTSTIGPYDIWAIEYGYSVLNGNEETKLAEIAGRSGERALAYATDEDTQGNDPDPYSNRWDLGKDPLRFAERQAKLIARLLPEVANRLASDGEDFAKARQAFNALLSDYGQAMYFVSRFVSGIEVSRSHKGDKNASAPLQVVDANRQRQALDILTEHLFDDGVFQFTPELYSQLAASHWNHWGTYSPSRADYPIHETILMWQERILDKLTSNRVLTRLHDSELTVGPAADALTVAELFDRLIAATFSELDSIAAAENPEFSNRQPAISSMRRNLQRSAMRRFAAIAMGRTAAPEDCQTIAFAKLSKLEERITELVEDDVALDDYTQAHLEETAARLRKALEAKVTQYAL